LLFRSTAMSKHSATKTQKSISICLSSFNFLRQAPHVAVLKGNTRSV
jgi:hypothetical protein